MQGDKPSTFQVAVSHCQKWSDRNQEYYHVIEFIDNSTGVLRTTYVSENNRNYQRWDQLIRTMEDKPGFGVCISGNFRCVKDKPELMNADATQIAFEEYVPLTEFMNLVRENYYA